MWVLRLYLRSGILSNLHTITVRQFVHFTVCLCYPFKELKLPGYFLRTSPLYVGLIGPNLWVANLWIWYTSLFYSHHQCFQLRAQQWYGTFPGSVFWYYQCFVVEMHKSAFKLSTGKGMWGPCVFRVVSCRTNRVGLTKRNLTVFVI